MKHIVRTALAVGILQAWGSSVLGGSITVRDANELQTQVRQAQPGTTITLAPGNYGNGITIEKLQGTKESPIIITGAKDQQLPIFTGGMEAIHFVDCNYITLRNIKVSGCTGNGINADDGGSYDTPSMGMVFDTITIERIGPTGNRDGLKLSGLNNFSVRKCTFSGWGGSAIDMVGCHAGVIEKCHFVGMKSFSQDTGIQAKGGCENILIKQNFFKSAGQRAVNLGGSTGLQFFRPKLQGYEAKSVEVAGNHFVGSTTPIAFVTSINCLVRQNTIINPDKWVIRILQEQPTNTFISCQQGVFENNLIVFDKRVQTFVNVGPNTKPETFCFRNNAWFCSDGNRNPSLPLKEMNGIYQINPMLENAETPDLKIGSDNPRLMNVGAHAFGRQDASHVR